MSVGALPTVATRKITNIMTEKEFLTQVWRPYDTAVLENGIRGRIVNVCFHTRSIRVNMPSGAPEWFKCEFIKEHKSATGESTDLGIIEELHEKLMKANKQIESLQAAKAQLEDKLRKNYVGDLAKNVNIVISELREKKKRIEKIEQCMADIEAVISRIDEEP